MLRGLGTVSVVIEPPVPGGLPPQPLPYGPNPVPPDGAPKGPSNLKVLMIVAACMAGIAVVCYAAAWLLG